MASIPDSDILKAGSLEEVDALVKKKLRARSKSKTKKQEPVAAVQRPEAQSPLRFSKGGAVLSENPLQGGPTVVVLQELDIPFPDTVMEESDQPPFPDSLFERTTSPADALNQDSTRGLRRAA